MKADEEGVNTAREDRSSTLVGEGEGRESDREREKKRQKQKKRQRR